MLAHWTDRLFVGCAKAVYYFAAAVGISVFSLQQGRLQPLSSKLRNYAWAVGFMPVALGWTPLIYGIVSTQLKVIEQDVAMYLPAVLYIIVFNLFLAQLKFIQLRQRYRVHKFIAQLVRLRRNTEALMSSTLPSCRVADRAHSLFQVRHRKLLTFFALFTSLHMLLFNALVLAAQIEDSSFSAACFNVMTLNYDLITLSFCVAYTLALLVFDAICCRLQQILSYIAPSRYSPPSAEQQLALEYLLQLNAWHLECNRLWSPALFFYYAMMFLEALSDFYVVFSQRLGLGDSTIHPLNYAKILMKLLAPYMINLIAERARQSFKRATDTVAFQLRYGRAGRLREHAYLLQLQEKSIAFRCFNLFCLDRALTITFFAQVFSYIITLIQFNIENS